MREDHYVLYKAQNGIWYYYVYRWGKRVFRSTGERRKSEALCVVHDRLIAGDLLNEGKQKRPALFSEYSEPFFVWDRCPIIRDKLERGGHYSMEFANSQRMQIKKYLVPAFGSKVLPEISPAMINTWLRSLPKKSGIAPQTANKVLSILRQILDYAVSENLLQENPAKAVKPLIPQEHERGCFTPDQVKKIFSVRWADYYVELACRLAATTGMRLGEVRGLLKEHVHADYIEVCHSYANREKLKSTKSGKSRIVPIPPALAQELLNVPQNGPYVISYDGTTPLWQTTITEKMNAHLSFCGIPYKDLGLSFHSFRHFFNTQLVAQGVNENQILAVVGHSSARMTQHYLHLEAGDMSQIRDVQNAI